MIEPVMTWMRERAADCEGPVLEVGALNINGSVRELFPEPYVGLDMREGIGVDVVGDVLTHHFHDGEFRTIVSTDTMEHVTEPWTAIERMGRWLAPGGKMLISVPLHFDVHGFPDDYWRMTPHGLAFLFERAGLQTVETELIDTHTYGMAVKA